jgi:hypothetical protein
VVRALLALYLLGPGERATLGARGRRYAMANLSYPVLGQRFLQACA